MDISYADFNPVMYDKEHRVSVAKRILTLLQVHTTQKNLKDKVVLDMGCSSGILTDYWSNYFKEITGIDIDHEALKYAKTHFKKKNLRFFYGSADKTGFKDKSFDIIICNQVYYWVKSQDQLAEEIYRLLKPGGICFLGARNKYTLWDAQYYLPLLGILPKSFADRYVKLAGKANSYECKYLNLWQIKKYYSKKLNINDYTLKILKDPKKYGYTNLSKISRITNLLPYPILEKIEFLLPNFILILKKPTH